MPENFCYRKLLTINFLSRFSLDFLSQRTKQLHKGKVGSFWILFDFILKLLTSVIYGRKKSRLCREKKNGQVIALWSFKSKETFLKFRFFCVLESKLWPLMHSFSRSLMNTEINKVNWISAGFFWGNKLSTFSITTINGKFSKRCIHNWHSVCWLAKFPNSSGH